jgi:CheY-like chemotaxis protein
MATHARKVEDLALIVDDEPEFLDWVVEFIESLGLKCYSATTLPDALAAVTETRYRVVLVDMNIPALNSLTPAMVAQTPLVSRYPGIAVAITCRNRGYGAHSVIAYTVHDDDAADRELSKLHCRYVLKGRPEVLKRVLKSSVASRPPHMRTKKPVAKKPS